MKIGDEVISYAGHRAYIIGISKLGDVDVLSSTGGVILLRDRWIGLTWHLTGNSHEGLRNVVEDICNTQNLK